MIPAAELKKRLEYWKISLEQCEREGDAPDNSYKQVRIRKCKDKIFMLEKEISQINKIKH